MEGEEPRQPTEREGLAGHAMAVASILGEPKAFLLFLFAVLALFEWSNYHKTERMVIVIQEVISGVETNRSREVSGQQQLVSDLIDILEYRSTGEVRPSPPKPAPPKP